MGRRVLINLKSLDDYLRGQLKTNIARITQGVEDLAEYLHLRDLKKVRKAMGVSQRDLAEASGINRRTLQRYEQCEMRASIERAAYIAGLLGLGVEDIVGTPVQPERDLGRSASPESGTLEQQILERLERIEDRLCSIAEYPNTVDNLASEKRGRLSRLFS